MAFFQNFNVGWQLGKQVRKLVFGDKKLLMYPVFIMVISILELGALFSIYFFSSGLSFMSTNSQLAELLSILEIFVAYLLITFTATYGIIAMLIAFRAYSSGKEMGLVEAISITSGYTKYILEWAIFYAIVLMVLRMMSRNRMIGFMANLVGGIALSIATIFVVPVIIDNKLGPIAAIKLSAKTFIDNFGRTVGGIAFIDLYNLVFILVGVAIFAGGILAFSLTGSLFAFAYGYMIPIIAMAAGVLFIIFGILMMYVSSNVYRFILYEFINGKPLPNGIDENLIKSQVPGAKG